MTNPPMMNQIFQEFLGLFKSSSAAVFFQLSFFTTQNVSILFGLHSIFSMRECKEEHCWWHCQQPHIVMQILVISGIKMVSTNFRKELETDKNESHSSNAQTHTHTHTHTQHNTTQHNTHNC